MIIYKIILKTCVIFFIYRIYLKCNFLIKNNKKMMFFNIFLICLIFSIVNVKAVNNVGK